MQGCPRRGDKEGADDNFPAERLHQGAQPHRVHQGVTQDQGVPSGTKEDRAGDRAGQGHLCSIAKRGAQG